MDQWGPARISSFRNKAGRFPEHPSALQGHCQRTPGLQYLIGFLSIAVKFLIIAKNQNNIKNGNNKPEATSVILYSFTQ